MSIFERVADIFQAKTHKLLNSLENPNDTLDLSYEKMITGLQETKRHLADVIAQQQSLKRQLGNVAIEIKGAEDDARTAVKAERDDLARAALVHKQDALHKQETLQQAFDAITPQVDKLVSYQQRLAARLEQFRTQKEVLKTTYTAAQAQVKVTESLTGIGHQMGGVGDAMRRAEDKVHTMRDKADAMDGMIESGVLSDPLDSRSGTQRELAAIRATSAVDDELAQLKAETTKAIAPPKP
jgi:phage shock protein A